MVFLTFLLLEHGKVFSKYDSWTYDPQTEQNENLVTGIVRSLNFVTLKNY